MNLAHTAKWNSGGVLLATLALIALASCDSSPTKPAPPAPACAFQVAPSTTSVPAAGGTINVSVTTTAACAWTAQTSASWLSIVSGASGTGNGVVVISGAANPDAAPRSGALVVAQQNLTLSQPARELTCEYTTSLESQRFGADGGPGRITVTAPAGCPWTAAADAPWITVTPAQGTGSAEVSFQVAEWTGAEERSTTIRIAGRATVIRQDFKAAPCAYSVDPVEFMLHWHHTSGEVRVQTNAGCVWTAVSGDAWVGLTPVDTAGSGAFSFTLSPHLAEATRRAPIRVRWPSPTEGQNVWVNQEGCYYAIGERDKTFARAGGRGFLLVFGTPVSQSCAIGCPWTVSSDVPWIRVLGNGSGAGDDGIFYDVDPNPGPSPRTGRITAAGYTLVITQVF